VLPANASGQVERVASRFALVGLAGELATHYAITGWQKSDATNAARTCFKAWLEARGCSGNLEEEKLLAQLRGYIEAHGESRFSFLDKEDQRVVNERIGFIRGTDEGREYIILPERFDKELCKGHDTKKAVKILASHGMLKLDADGKAQKRETLPGFGRRRCYVILASKLFEGEEK
jgi:putative DNA primase/helicase